MVYWVSHQVHPTIIKEIFIIVLPFYKFIAILRQIDNRNVIGLLWDNKKTAQSVPSFETVKKLPVIANQSADWCGDPPKFRETCVLSVENVAFNWGIPTPVCALARNDHFFSAEVIPIIRNS